MGQKHITINFDDIRDIANKGVRRAALFLGLGLNAANDPRLREYELTNISAIQLIQPDADDETLSHYKEEFSTWVVACALREMIESFGVFLDGIYEACLVMAVHRGRVTPQDANFQKGKFSFTVIGAGEDRYRAAPQTHSRRPIHGIVRHHFALKSNAKLAFCFAAAPLSKLDQLETP